MSRELNLRASWGPSPLFAPVSKQSATMFRVLAGLFVIAAMAQAQTIEFRASHVRLGKDCPGTLRFEDAQVSWTPDKAKRACKPVAWPYGELQKFAMEERRIEVTGYADRKRRLGLDERYTFRLSGDPAGAPLYALLRTKMDSRFEPRWADPALKVEWVVPAKMLSTRFPTGNWGGEGKLTVAADGVTFSSARAGYSRTWLDKEIENVSSEPPFRLTLAVREGGVAKMVEFQLKQELDTAQFDALWRRLNRPRGLKLLNDIEEQAR